MTPSGGKALLIVAHPAGDKPEGPAPLPSLEGGEPDRDETSSGEKCETCRFYRDSDMRCQRFPPHGMDWSQVEPDAWCGEWRGGPQHDSDSGESGEMGEPSAEPQQDAQPNYGSMLR